ncbi:hypothetical protein EAH87_02645 [Sphingomonas koreensis]|nr:hypothetical protein EAH87_02645 [Sphingomonas koreensis]
MNMARITDVLSRFRRNGRGNVLMIFAFAMIPMVFATAMGVDYAHAVRLQTKMNALADAAALAAVTQPMMQQTAGSACDVARNTFTTQSTPLAAEGLVFKAGQTEQFTITVSDTVPKSDASVVSTCLAKAGTTTDSGNLPLSRTAKVTYSAASTNSFGGILGMSTLPIAGTATANTTLAPYIDIYMALDTSQSMGLAATNDDALKLWKATAAAGSRSCTFGCHVVQYPEDQSKVTDPLKRLANDQIARNNGISLRIDVLRQATQDIVQTAIDDEGGANGDKKLYRFGLYRIGETTSDISALTQDLTGKTLPDVQSLQLGMNDAGGTGDTNLPDMTNFIFPKIKYNGDGTSSEKARPFLFIVTDGVKDTKGSCVDGHCVAPIDPKTCQKYKDAGVTVGVVYTTYLPVYADPTNVNNHSLRPEYTDLILGIADQIAPSLKSCASSPDWFFEASDGPGIHAAIQRLFTQATQAPAITH